MADDIDGCGTPGAATAHEKGEAKGAEGVKRPGVVRRHPVWTLLLVLVVAPLTALVAEWALLRLTTKPAIVDELHAMGLPANGLELETWKHPADDGRKEMLEALTMLDQLQKRMGDEKFTRLTQYLMPKEFTQNRSDLDVFFQEFQPIRQKMEQASQHADITFGIAYRGGLSSKITPVLLFRQYIQALRQNSRYEALLRHDPAAAQKVLQSGFALTQRLRSYTYIEHYILLACDGVLVKTTAEISEFVPPAAMLRQTASLLLNPVAGQQRDGSLTIALAGELAMLQDIVPEIGRVNPEAGLSRGSSLDICLGWVLRDVEYRAFYELRKRFYLLTRKSFPEVADSLTVLQHDWLEFRKRSVLCRLALTPGMVVTESSNDINAFRWHNNMLAQTLQAGIACELAADRLEGKDWPKDLSDARFPSDPFTDQPFKLLLTKEAVWIVSVGMDRKDSGLAERYNKTGVMPNPPCDEDGKWGGDNPFQSADDVVFRLPRAPYENASR